MSVTRGHRISGAIPTLPEEVLAALRVALVGTPVARAYLERWSWVEEGQPPYETTELALELTKLPDDEGLTPAELQALLDPIVRSLGEAEVPISIPGARALDGLLENGVLIYERDTGE